jgi:catechol 2,3-dioxygenase-like lactoylglutathione lyase family enzyme
MQVTHLDHLNMSVRNFDESAEWYARILGFKVVERGVIDGITWGVLRSGDATLCIYQHPEFSSPTDEAQINAAVHHVRHFALRITDRAAWEATVKHENLHLEFGGLVTWPHSLAWYIRDPSGYSIEIALWNSGSPDFTGRPTAPENKGTWPDHAAAAK